MFDALSVNLYVIMSQRKRRNRQVEQNVFYFEKVMRRCGEVSRTEKKGSERGARRNGEVDHV